MRSVSVWVASDALPGKILAVINLSTAAVPCGLEMICINTAVNYCHCSPLTNCPGVRVGITTVRDSRVDEARRVIDVAERLNRQIGRNISDIRVF